MNNVPKNIETFVWRGQTRYRCPLNWESGGKCEFNTDSLDDLNRHMAKGNHQRLVIKDPNAAMQISSLSHADEPPLKTEAEFRNLSFSKE